MDENLSLLKTSLGNIICGTTPSQADQQPMGESAIPILFTGRNVGPTTEEQIHQLWNMEGIRIKDNYEQEDDDLAMEQFKKSIELKDGQYYINWPWRNLTEKIPRHYELALSRFDHFNNYHPRRQPALLEKYNQVILEQIQLGIIEEAPQKELQSPLYPCSYIPHQAVFRYASTTTKLRVVYDASAKGMSDMSVNQYLLRGPVMLADLCGLLMRFHLAKIALVSDIEKAFLNTGLHSSQRDITQFFWLKDITKPFMKENTVVF